MKISLLIFEDSVAKMQSFEQLLKLRLEHELKFSLETTQRSDDSMLESDLMTKDFHVILIDNDLGNNLWGNEIIDKIILITDSTPEVANTPKVYYSAGRSISELKEKTKHHGNIPCATFENLAEFIFNLIKSKYYK